MTEPKLVLHIYQDDDTFFVAYPDFVDYSQSNLMWIPRLAENLMNGLEANGMSFSAVPEYYSLRFVRILLGSLTKDFPPAPGMRHNITLSDSGMPQITLMFKDKYITVEADREDLDSAFHVVTDKLRALFHELIEGEGVG